MIIDRYLYKSKTFISVQEKNRERREHLGELPIGQLNNVNMESNENRWDLEIERGKSVKEFMKGEQQEMNVEVPNDFESTNSEKEGKRRKLEK